MTIYTRFSDIPETAWVDGDVIGSPLEFHARLTEWFLYNTADETLPVSSIPAGYRQSVSDALWNDDVSTFDGVLTPRTPGDKPLRRRAVALITKLHDGDLPFADVATLCGSEDAANRVLTWCSRRNFVRYDGGTVRLDGVLARLRDYTEPKPTAAPKAPSPDPDPAYAADIDQFHPSHPDYLPPVKPSAPPAVHGVSPDAPTARTPRKPQGTQPKPEQLPAPPTKPAAFEVLLDVQRRVKRVEDFFSPTVVDPTGADVLLQSAHPDTVNCLRRVCVLLQVYGSQQRYQLTNGRVSSKHKSRLPEAISLGLRLGVIGLSTADGKSLTLGDYTTVMPDAELERRAAEQRVRDVRNKPRTIREVVGI